jgi:hypothetical protein
MMRHQAVGSWIFGTQGSSTKNVLP